MVKLLLINSLLVLTLIAIVSRALKKDFSSPVNTLKTLQKSIKKENWSTAGECFTEEIRNQNKGVINKSDFYFMHTGTIQSVLGPIPVLPKNAKFTIEKIENQHASVEVSYPNYIEKDGRIKKVKLQLEKEGWKVAQVLMK